MASILGGSVRRPRQLDAEVPFSGGLGDDGAGFTRELDAELELETVGRQRVQDVDRRLCRVADAPQGLRQASAGFHDPVRTSTDPFDTESILVHLNQHGGAITHLETHDLSHGASPCPRRAV